MDSNSNQQVKLEQGLSTSVVIGFGILLVGLMTYAVYLLGSQFGGSQNDSTPNQPTNISEPQASKPVPIKAAASTKSEPPAPPTEAAKSKTLDIGAYLTYGGEAFTLTRAIAKVTPDKKRLLVGLFEATQAPKERPALAMIFELKNPQAGCSLANISQLDFIFNLRAMGSIQAQQVQSTKRSADEIRLALEKFSCNLTPGGKLQLNSVGADLELLKPRGSTFGWGLRLTQEIE